MLKVIVLMTMVMRISWVMSLIGVVMVVVKAMIMSAGRIIVIMTIGCGILLNVL